MTETTYPHLEQHAWTPPSSYFGFNPSGDYCIATMHRDSDALERSNYACIGSDLMGDGKAGDLEPPWYAPDDGMWSASPKDYATRPNVYQWEASHCLVGWVRYIMIRCDAPKALLETAEGALAMLADYPVYNEDHWSDLEFNEACDTWEAMGIRGRAEFLKECLERGLRGVSIFAARRAEMPSDDQGYILERLRG